MPNQLANRIRRARRKKGMTQAELAARLNVSRSAVGNWESPTGIMPCTTRLITIALVTEVSFEWLATGRNGLEAIPAPPSNSEVELVDDPQERRLLRGYRTCRAATRKLVLQIVEGQRTSHP